MKAFSAKLSIFHHGTSRMVMVCLFFLMLISSVYSVQEACSADSPSAGSPANQQERIALSAPEQQWLSEHRTIRVAFDGYFPPYSFLNHDGEMEGLAVDVIQLIAARAGFTIEISPKTVWKDLYEAAQKREIDLVATMGHQPDREQWFVFTQPYIFKSLVIMTRSDADSIRQPEDLSGRQVALVKSYQYVKPLLEEYPAIKPYYVDTMLDGLNAVAIGKADAAITFLGAGHHLITKYQISNLKFAAVFERDRFTDSIAVRKDWPELAAILDKALSSITDKEMMQLRKRWIGPEAELGIAPKKVYTYFAVFLGTVFLFAIGFIAWNRSLKRQVDRKTAELQQELTERRKVEEALQESERFARNILDSMQVNIAVVDKSGVILKVNRAWEEFALDNSEGKTVRAGAGDNYFDVCRKAEGESSEEAAEVLRGFEAVLAGQIDYFDIEYPCHSPAEQRWFLMRAVSLQTQTGGLVISHFHITEIKETEEQLQASESRYRRLHEGMMDGFALVDMQDNICDLRAVETAFGFVPERFEDALRNFIQRY